MYEHVRFFSALMNSGERADVTAGPNADWQAGGRATEFSLWHSLPHSSRLPLERKFEKLGESQPALMSHRL